MTQTWVTADPHFGHRGVCNFLAPDGVTKLRPWNDPDEMDEALVNNWNSVVRPEDRVYLLGDVVINRRCLITLSRLKGRLKLVKGNHDIFKLKDYLPYFDDICAYVVKTSKSLYSNGADKIIMSHIPIHPEQLGRFGVNIHGHLHAHVVKRWNGSLGFNEIDKRYTCVSVEQTNWAPILLEDAIARTSLS